MQQTANPANHTTEDVARAKCDFERHSVRLLHVLSFVPDDKLNWAPSSEARSSLRIAAHCALTSRFFTGILCGTLPEKMPSPAEFSRSLRDAEQEITSRDSAVALLNETAAELCRAIGTVNAGNLHELADSPFGAMEKKFWIRECGDHIAGHARQIDYLQTIWGDTDDHMG